MAFARTARGVAAKLASTCRPSRGAHAAAAGRNAEAQLLFTISLDASTGEAYFIRSVSSSRDGTQDVLPQKRLERAALHEIFRMHAPMTPPLAVASRSFSWQAGEAARRLEMEAEKSVEGLAAAKPQGQVATLRRQQPGALSHSLAVEDRVPPWHATCIEKLSQVLRSYRDEVHHHPTHLHLDHHAPGHFPNGWHHHEDSLKTEEGVRRGPRAEEPLRFAPSSSSSVDDDVADGHRHRRTDHVPFLQASLAGVVQREQALLAGNVLQQQPHARSQQMQQQKQFGGGAEEEYLASFADGGGAARHVSVSRESNGLRMTNALSNRHHIVHSAHSINRMDEYQASLAARAAHVVGVVAAVERLVPLAPWQRKPIARAAAEGTPPPPTFQLDAAHHAAVPLAQSPAMGVSQPHLTDQQHHQDHRHIVTPHSAWAAVSFLMRDCGFDHRQAADTVASFPWLLSIKNPTQTFGPVLECFNLLSVSQAQLAELISSDPEMLLADADRDVLPMLAYLSGLGMEEDDCVALLRRRPSLLARGARETLKSVVAFWVGRGLSKQGLRTLLLNAVDVVDMSQQEMQVKANWLAEHASFQADDFAACPQALQLSLVGTVGPRIAFAHRWGSLQVVPPSRHASNAHGDDVNDNWVKDNHPMDQSSGATLSKGWVPVKNVLEGDDGTFVQLLISALHREGTEESPQSMEAASGFEASEAAPSVLAKDAVLEEYQRFAQDWRRSEFRAWLTARSPCALMQDDSFEWTDGTEEQLESRQIQDQHIAWLEMAMEQQHERQKEWKATWQRWRAEQKERDMKSGRKRYKERKELQASALQLVRNAELEDMALVAKTAVDVHCERSVYCSRLRGHIGECNRSRVTTSVKVAMEAKNFHENYVKKLGSQAVDITDGDEATDGDAGATIAPPAPQDRVPPRRKRTHPKKFCFQVPDLDALDPERVRSCAHGIEELMRASPCRAVVPETIQAWAKQHGYSFDYVTAAKAALALHKRAVLLGEPNHRHYKIPRLYWVLVEDEEDGREGTRQNQHGQRDHVRHGALNGMAVPPFILPTKGNVGLSRACEKMLSMLTALPEGRILRNSPLLGESISSVETPHNGFHFLGEWSHLGKWNDSYVGVIVMVLAEEGRIGLRRVRGKRSGPVEIIVLDVGRFDL